MRLPTLAAGALTLAGCALDFDQFRVAPRPDASVDAAPDATPDAALDAAPDAPDAPGDAPDADGPRSDAPAVDAATCMPGRSSTGSFRFAHMAAGVGAVDLCMRRRSNAEAFQRVAAPLWSTGGVAYGQVSTSLPFNVALTRANEAWEFAVVPLGTPCAQASTRAITLRAAQLDPGAMRLLVLTSERGLDGGASVGVLNVLNDQGCTDCQSRLVDVRAVHASPLSAAQRLTVALEPVIDPRLIPQDLASMRVFAASVGYGGASDYACNALWGWFTYSLVTVVPVQFTASTAAGSLIARSDSTRLKASLLAMTRAVTVFFESGVNGADAGFVVCYDGLSIGGLATCDRVATRPLAVTDAGPGDAAPSDAADDVRDAADDDDLPDAAADDVRDAADDDLPDAALDDASDAS